MLDFSKLCVERPLGSDGNYAVINLLKDAFSSLPYKYLDLPFDCTIWERGRSYIEQGDSKTEILPSPYSQGLKGVFPIKYVSSLTELQSISNFNGVLIFKDDLTKTALFPKDFPFYFPEEDKAVYEAIEKIAPAGIIAISGQDPVSGLNPFPIFEDANLQIPTAYASSLSNIVEGGDVSIEINSRTDRAKSAQVVFRKEGASKEIILIAAHMDTKYFTNGAIDNASGVYTLFEIAKLLQNIEHNHTIEIVPFNGEDCPEVGGQLAYLNYLRENGLTVKAAINIDGVGHVGSKNMFSFYNFDEDAKNGIVAKNNLLEGEPWYSGDHGIFAFQGVPCVAVTSSDMFTDVMKITHTRNDTMELVDLNLLMTLSEAVADAVKVLDGK